MSQATQQRAVIWPATYLSGTTDNFVPNEIVVAGLSVRAVWVQLGGTTRWPTYCSNVADIRFHNGSGSLLGMDARSRSMTFGSSIGMQITEYVPPVDGQATCVTWRGWTESDATTRLDMIHA